MNIKLAKYIYVTSKSDSDNLNIHIVLNTDVRMSVPLDEDNSDYIEIMRQVDAGELTIEAAEEVTPEPVDD